MKCPRCGADIPADRVYCSVCGKEIQLVPDYNFLEDDMLSDIIQKGADETVTSSGTAQKTAGKVRKDSFQKKGLYAAAGMVVFFLLAAGVAGLIHRDMEKRHAKSYDYQYQQGEKCLAEKDYAQAQEYFQNALALRPEDSNAQWSLIHLCLDTGEEQEAVRILLERIKTDARDRDAYETLIEIYANDQEYDKIRMLYDEIRDMELLDLFDDYLVDQPSFSRISGTYQEPLEIELSSDKAYDIYYTLDERDPIEFGILYRDAIMLKEGTTVITAVTRNEMGIYSEAVQASYTIRIEAPSMPKVTPAGGTYSEPQQITIQVPHGCKAYYTWDGSDPDRSSQVYTGPVEMPQGNHVLSVLLVNSAGLESRINRINYIYMP